MISTQSFQSIWRTLVHRCRRAIHLRQTPQIIVQTNLIHLLVCYRIDPKELLGLNKQWSNRMECTHQPKSYPFTTKMTLLVTRIRLKNLRSAWVSESLLLPVQQLVLKPRVLSLHKNNFVMLSTILKIRQIRKKCTKMLHMKTIR